MTNPMPAIFFGHGNPMNALMHNAWTDGWAAIGKETHRPKAILSVSAHWHLPATLVTAMPSPRTIHDFGGFPRELYEVKYPAPGDPELARHIQSLLAPLPSAWTISGALITARGRCFVTSFLKRISPSCNSALMRRNRLSSTTKLRSVSRRCATKGCSLWEAATSCITCTPTRGVGNRSPRCDWAVRFEERARELLLVGDHDPLIAYDDDRTGRHLVSAHT